ncbi:MAG: carboxyl transferase domain-containing protein [Acidimicrobiia bacterium]
MPEEPALSADAHIEDLLGAFDAWDGTEGGPTSADPLGWPGYATSIAAYGGRESVTTGWARVGIGHGRTASIAVVAFDFEMIGGSLGLASGERIVRAFDRAREERLPVLTWARSGGARMQEGMVALVQMARVADAARRHAEAGLVQIAYLDSPTTGGVYASLASLADLIWAAPGATIGFAGPRVVQQSTGVALPPDAHTAESAYAAGIVDAVLDRTVLVEHTAALLRVLSSEGPSPGEAPSPGVAAAASSRAAGVVDAPEPPPLDDAWAAVVAARAPARPSGAAWLDRLVPERVATRGDRAGGVDDVVRAGLGLTTRGRAVAYVALDRHTADGRPRPAGYRTARRLVALAARLHLPLLTIVDTPGADLSDASERGGIAGEIARTFAAVTGHRAPTVSLTVGEGGSGGALAFAATDRAYLLDGAIFSVIGPEGAAAILERDSSKAPQVAPLLKLTAPDLVRLGIVDGVVGPDTAADVLESALATARPGDGRARLDAATRRWVHSR